MVEVFYAFGAVLDTVGFFVLDYGVHLDDVFPGDDLFLDDLQDGIFQGAFGNFEGVTSSMTFLTGAGVVFEGFIVAFGFDGVTVHG